jgi:hypothetical protein
MHHAPDDPLDAQGQATLLNHSYNIVPLTDCRVVVGDAINLVERRATSNTKGPVL